MYKLLIVDDEDIILNGIITTFDWFNLGYEIVGQATNGVEALELYNKLKPDVILTDIKMSDMDGLTLLKKVKELHPAVEVVLLSGYDDFEYAKQGIRLGAYDYLLKIDMFDELEDTFKRVYNSLTFKRNKEEEYKSSIKQKEEYKFLKAIDKEYIIDKDEIQDNYYCMLVLYMKNQLKPYYLRSIKERLSDKDIIIYSKDNYYIIILNKDTHSQLIFENYVNNLVEYIQVSIESLYKGRYIIGIGKIKNDIKLARESFIEASKMIDYGREINDKEKIIYDYSKENNRMKQINTSIDLDLIYKYIALEEQDKIIKMIDEHIKSCILCHNCLITDITGLYSKILVELHIESEKNGVKSQNGINKVISQLSKISSFIECKAWMNKTIKENYRDKALSLKSDTLQQIDKAIVLIEERYHLDIKLEEVAKYVHMSSPYFSAKFKEAMNVNFKTYIKEKRVNAACQLLETTDHKIYEIAKKVGYNDEKHFSKIFKKYLGMSPKEYKSINDKK
ncbi:response regulator transcription factor [Vallitalea sp.]|jgi:two-component system response regulator YesN|uniref:response regulator transcription factor n=1 Tax=Vallitalea sp. TaxID=1882829 RepID=UPI0025F449C7|nr:response regulator [Vallitalea sp.]MCT4688821.1 response regulator [Vallitalea sp.]